MAANTNWYNAHNFYGDLTDIEAAKLDDVKKFFKTYYAPNNAALAIVGDFDPRGSKEVGGEIFRADQGGGGSPAARSHRAAPGKRKAHHQDRSRWRRAGARHRLPHARPQHAGVLRHGPDRADAHRRQRQLCSTRNWCRSAAYTGSVEGGINLLGNMFNYNGPMLLAGGRASTTRRPTPDDVLKAMDDRHRAAAQEAGGRAVAGRARG